MVLRVLTQLSIYTRTSRLYSPQDLVPEKCCQIVAFSQSYKESFVCNFLGLSATAEIPKHVMSSDLHVVVNIQSVARMGGGARTGRGQGGEGEERGSPLSGYRLVVQSSSKSSDSKCRQ